MVSTPEGFTYNSPMSSGPSVTEKQHNVRKSLRQFSETLDVKPNTDVCRLCADISKRKEIRAVIMLWYSLTKQLGHKKINECVKRALLNWIQQNS